MTSAESRPRHFDRVCRLAANAAKDFAMLGDGDRVLVGLSGGEDSLVLMHVLERLQERTPFHFEFVAVTIDMRFPGMNIPALRAYCAEHGWPHHVISLDGTRILREKGAGDRPCPLCSRLRRGKLYEFAAQEGFTCLALGQQLDDLCVSFLLSVFRGQGVKTMGPHVPADAGRRRLIRPLCYVPKEIIHNAALALELPSFKGCPYLQALHENGDRAYLERLLDTLDVSFKNVRRNILTSLRTVEVEHLLDLSYLPEIMRQQRKPVRSPHLRAGPATETMDSPPNSPVFPEQ